MAGSGSTRTRRWPRARPARPGRGHHRHRGRIDPTGRSPAAVGRGASPGDARGAPAGRGRCRDQRRHHADRSGDRGRRRRSEAGQRRLGRAGRSADVRHHRPPRRAVCLHALARPCRPDAEPRLVRGRGVRRGGRAARPDRRGRAGRHRPGSTDPRSRCRLRQDRRAQLAAAAPVRRARRPRPAAAGRVSRARRSSGTLLPTGRETRGPPRAG